ncbi:MAG: hypothetical protein ACP5MH_12315 [Thermoproteus sp.]
MEVLCAYLREAASMEAERAYCRRRGWRGAACRVLQILDAVSGYPGAEVPLSAERLGLGPPHVPYLARLQAELGPSPLKEEAAARLFLIVRRLFAREALKRLYGP